MYSTLDFVVKYKDISFNEKGMTVVVYSTKTLKHKERSITIPVFYVKKNCLCAASLLKRYFSWRSWEDTDYLFYLFEKGRWVPLKYNALLNFLKKLCSNIKLDPSLYGLHSLRRASATFYHECGLSLTDVMMAGDWKSLCVKEYLTLPNERKNKIEFCVSSKLNEF